MYFQRQQEYEKAKDHASKMESDMLSQSSSSAFTKMDKRRKLEDDCMHRVSIDHRADMSVYISRSSIIYDQDYKLSRKIYIFLSQNKAFIYCSTLTLHAAKFLNMYYIWQIILFVVIVMYSNHEVLRYCVRYFIYGIGCVQFIYLFYLLVCALPKPVESKLIKFIEKLNYKNY